MSFTQTSSVIGWHSLRGTPVCVICEFGTRTTNTVARYRQIGQRFLEATAAVDSAGFFFTPTEEYDLSADSLEVDTEVSNAAFSQQFNLSAVSIQSVTHITSADAIAADPAIVTGLQAVGHVGQVTVEAVVPTDEVLVNVVGVEGIGEVGLLFNWLDIEPVHSAGWVRIRP